MEKSHTNSEPTPAQIKDGVRDYYDRIGWRKNAAGEFVLNAIWRGSGIHQRSTFRREQRELAAFKSGGDMCVEIGCGANPQRVLAGRFRAHICLDFSMAGLAAARQSSAVPTEYYANADVCLLPLADETADGVLCANLLYHVPATQQGLALREIHRILKPGATAIISYDNKTMFDDRLFNKLLNTLSKCRRRICRNPVGAESENAPVDHYFYLHPRNWIAEQLPRSTRVEIRSFQIASQGFLMRRMRDTMFWRVIDCILYKLESVFPHVTLPITHHLTVVLRK